MVAAGRYELPRRRSPMMIPVQPKHHLDAVHIGRTSGAAGPRPEFREERVVERAGIHPVDHLNLDRLTDTPNSWRTCRFPLAPARKKRKPPRGRLSHTRARIQATTERERISAQLLSIGPELNELSLSLSLSLSRMGVSSARISAD